MPRLVTFGCSYTYGHGLPDCVTKSHGLNVGFGAKPSDFAWPQLLANKLGYECLNLSVCGSGNFEILIDVLRTKFNPDDLVIIGYSYFTRYYFYQMVDKVDKGFPIPQTSPEHKNIVLRDLNTEHWHEKMYWDNWLTIQHIELLLDSMGIKNFSFVHIPGGGKENKPDLIKLNNFIPDMKFIRVDTALDNAHPGLESHRLQAEEIYSRINV